MSLLNVLVQASMPELRNDPRFVQLCAGLGPVEFGEWPDRADEVPYDFRAECTPGNDTARDEFGF